VEANLRSKLQENHKFAVQDLQKQIANERMIQENTARIISRLEAEIADLKATIANLEVNLEKVHFLLPILKIRGAKMFQANRSHLHDLQAAHQEYTAKLSAQSIQLERVERRARDFEATSKAACERELKVRSSLVSLYES
jgi:chromosome segregation ATPase